jgi:hypothetical protein
MEDVIPVKKQAPIHLSRSLVAIEALVWLNKLPPFTIDYSNVPAAQISNDHHGFLLSVLDFAEWDDLSLFTGEHFPSYILTNFPPRCFMLRQGSPSGANVNVSSFGGFISLSAVFAPVLCKLVHVEPLSC